MLEQRIEELTVAVKALTEVMARGAVSNAEVALAKLEKKSPKDAATASKPETSASGTPQSSGSQGEAPNVSPTSEPSELESAPVSYDDVKKATNALSAAKGRDVTIATLAVFNVQKATQLVEAQWADYVAYATKVASDA